MIEHAAPVARVEALSVEKRQPRPFIEQFMLKDGRVINLLGEGPDRAAACARRAPLRRQGVSG